MCPISKIAKRAKGGGGHPIQGRKGGEPNRRTCCCSCCSPGAEVHAVLQGVGRLRQPDQLGVEPSAADRLPVAGYNKTGAMVII